MDSLRAVEINKKFRKRGKLENLVTFYALLKLVGHNNEYICVKCYSEGVLSFTPHFICGCGNKKFFAKKGKIMTNEIAISQEAPLVSFDIIEEIAKRLKATYSPPPRKGKSDEEYKKVALLELGEFRTVVELSFADGFNPLSRDFHYGKMDGKIFIIPHYAHIVRWAQAVEPFHYSIEHLSKEEKAKLPGVDVKDFVARCVIIKDKDRDQYNLRYNMVLKPLLENYDPEEAFAMAERMAQKEAATVSTGIVKHNEVYSRNGSLLWSATPKGWTPGETRAETRALRAAITRSHGWPSAAERRKMSFGDMEESQMLELASKVPEEIAEEGYSEKYMQIEASYEENRKEREDLTPKERARRMARRVNRLRGEKDDGLLGEEDQETERQKAKRMMEQHQNELESGDSPMGEALSIGDIRQLLLENGYRTTARQNDLIRSFYEGHDVSTLNELSEIQVGNMIEFAKRVNFITSNMGEPNLMELIEENIPELSSLSDLDFGVYDEETFDLLRNEIKDATEKGNRVWPLEMS